MTEIHKKISREYYDLIFSGQKTFEYRVNDFECNPGDILVLEEYESDNETGRHPTGRIVRKKVGHIGRTKDYAWLDRPDVKESMDKNGAQIISLLDCDAANEEKSLTPVIVVGGVIEQDGKYLLVKEAKDGYAGQWNLPAGRLDPGETIFEAAKREIKEESGFDVDLTGVCQIGSINTKNLAFVSVIFSTKISGGHIEFNPNEIQDVRWFTYEEILGMENQLRSANFVIGAIDNFRSGLVSPLEIVKVL